MISVAEALNKVLGLARVTDVEMVPLRQAAGRVLAHPLAARRTQPPFAASAMDGYALRAADAVEGAQLTVLGEAAAGHGFAGAVTPGHAVRIFTGAPVPQGADRVVIQEDVTRDGDQITLGTGLDKGLHIRPAGGDFSAGDLFDAPRRLSAPDIAFLAAMNHGHVPVFARPTVALIATGDELVMPGEDPGPDQIIASNAFGIAAQIEARGASARILPIAGDSLQALDAAFDLAKEADLIVTIGGASVGDHDLVGAAAEARGMDRAFYKIAMRPGKPLMAGRLGQSALLGLPGNPVSSMVCTTIFMLPLLDAMQGLPATPARTQNRTLSAALPANGPRAHYMRGITRADGTVKSAGAQDSSLLSVLSRADCLILRPPHAPAARVGDRVPTLPI